jgi:hypothetical protein
VGAPQHGGQEAEGEATEVREQQSKWELLSMAAKGPREKQVVAREQQSEWGLFSTAAKRPREQRPERVSPHTTVK